MNLITLSPKFQIVIPKKIREELNLSPGIKLSVVAMGKHIHLVPVESMKNIGGLLPNLDTSVVREADRKL